MGHHGTPFRMRSFRWIHGVIHHPVSHRRAILAVAVVLSIGLPLNVIKTIHETVHEGHHKANELRIIRESPLARNQSADPLLIHAPFGDPTTVENEISSEYVEKDEITLDKSKSQQEIRHKSHLSHEYVDPHNGCEQERFSAPQGLGYLYDIALFYHIGMIGPWQQIVHDQLSIVEKCGLGYLAKSMTIAYTHPSAEDAQHYPTPIEQIQDIGKKYSFTSRINITFVDASSSKPFERSAMEAISSYCHESIKENPQKTTIVFYFHNKGSSKYAQLGEPNYDKYLNIYYWRRYMEFFLLERPTLCTRAILHHGTMTCGVNLQLNPRRHYSGNFWSASCAHIQDLPVGDFWFKNVDSFLSEYITAELWIGNYTSRKEGDELKYLTLFNIRGDLYTYRSLPDAYSFVVEEKTFLQNNHSSSYYSEWDYLKCYDSGNQTDIWLDYLSGLLNSG